MKSISRFFVRAGGVPLYRLYFWMRRRVLHVYFPTRHHLLYVFSNRYAVHGVVMLIIFVTSTMNIRAQTVRADTFGEGSYFRGLVESDLGSERSDEIVSVDANPGELQPTSYQNEFVLSADTFGDNDGFTDDYVTTVIGGSSFAAPTIQQDGESRAPRDAVIDHVIQSGDTLYALSERFGLKVSSLLWANNLTVRSTLRPGQTLHIPPEDGVVYVVKRGDTLSSISKIYGADTARILAFNRLSSSATLQVGNSLFLPGGTPPTPVAAPRATISRIFSSAPQVTSAPVSAGNVVFAAWPTDWRVITQYYGFRHTGIDIDGNFNTNNYAVADGVVVYAGWRNGYGLTVEIDHGSGVMTRYGHFSKLAVGAGEVVSAGTALGKTGTTGRSTGTHLHFEVIINGKFRNPLEYIR